MKHRHCMNSMLLNRRRENGLRNRLSIKMLVRIAISVSMFAMMLTADGCRQKDRNNQNAGKKPVSLEDIHIRYVDPEKRKQELERFEQMIDAKGATEKPYALLRLMIERVPLQEIQAHLQELRQNTSREERPNVFILLEQINGMRNLDDVGLSQFIRKAKEDGDADKLTVAVFGLRSEGQQATAAETLASVGKPESVRLLAMRLFRAVGTSKGGLESKLYRQELRQSLVKALGSSTRLDFSDYDPTSDTATLAVVKRCQDWLEENEPKVN